MVEIKDIGSNKGQNKNPEQDIKSKNALLHGARIILEEQAIDYSLVKEARRLLEEDYQVYRNEYSSIHYEEIMDKQCPFTCWRYLMHRELNVGSAVKLMVACLKWRKETGVDKCLNGELVKEIWFHSPSVWTGMTKTGKEDVLYILCRNYKKPAAILRSTVVKFWANLLLEWDRKNRYNLRQAVFVFDHESTGLANVDIEFVRWLVTVKDFLPSRICAVYLTGVPFILRPIVQLIISWLPESFRNILKCGTFEELVLENIGPESLPPEVGGTAISAYLAPLDAPWMSESTIYSTKEMQKAFKETVWFYVTEERKDQMLAQQLEHEAKVSKSKK